MIVRHFIYSVYIVLTLVLSLFLCSCSAEKNGVAKNPEKDGVDSFSRTSSSATGAGESSSQSLTKSESMGKKEETLLTDTRPVVVKAAFKGERINNVDSLKVLVEGKDRGGAGVTFKFEWTKNGEPAGDGDTLSGLKRGDKISVKITPYNGKEYGQSKIVTTEIWNIPPKVIDFKKLAFDGKAYAYQVKAMDPDGDPLTYSIKSGPPRMTINSTTGLIQWDVPPDFVGKAPVSVSVTDGHGGEALYNFDATIKIEGSK